MQTNVTRLYTKRQRSGVSHMFVDGAEAEVVKHEFTLSLQPAKESVDIGNDVAKVC